jgi:hypothetical protein
MKQTGTGLNLAQESPEGLLQKSLNFVLSMAVLLTRMLTIATLWVYLLVSGSGKTSLTSTTKSTKE